MKLIIQKQTGLDETTVVELDNLDPGTIQEAYHALDARLWETNQKIVEVREWMAQIKDPNYRYLFVSFFDNLMGISSQAEPLARKFKLEPPANFDEWLMKGSRQLEPVPGRK